MSAERTNGLADFPPGSRPKILVSDGTGYIGSVPVRRHLERGYRVLAAPAKAKIRPADERPGGKPTLTADLAARRSSSHPGVGGPAPEAPSGACSWLGFTEAITGWAGTELRFEAVTTTIPRTGVEQPLHGVLARSRADSLKLSPPRRRQKGLADHITGRDGRSDNQLGDDVERIETRLEGPILIQPKSFGDERGFFCETYRRSGFADLGIPEEMVQDNHSRSGHGVVRGMHFQVGAGAAKLVRCGRGAIYDVVIDLRRHSPTYGEWEGHELSDENLRIFYCPIGFAHGFCVLSDVADVIYKQSNYYAAETERGIAYDDPDVGIKWPLPGTELIPSERDATAPRLAEVAAELPFE